MQVVFRASGHLFHTLSNLVLASKEPGRRLDLKIEGADKVGVPHSRRSLRPFMIRLLLCVITSVLLLCPASINAQEKTEERARDEAKKERKQFEKEQKEKWKYFAVRSDPPGARVVINGEYIDTTPIRNEIKVKFFYYGPTFGIEGTIRLAVILLFASAAASLIPFCFM